MTATTHPITPEEIMALLDGELPTVQAQSISAHIDSCPECRTQLQEFRSTTQKLFSWEVGKLPATVETRVHTAVIKNSVPKHSLSTRIFLGSSFWTWKQWLSLSAVTAITFVFLLGFFSSDHSMRSMSPLSERDYRAKAADREQIPASVDNAKIVPLGTPKAQNESDSLPMSEQNAKIFRAPMIARTVSLSLLVKDFDASRESLDSILVRHSGYSADLSVNTPQGAARSLQASLRIPASQLIPAVAELKSLGHIENESQSGEEVTQQHADLVARLKNSRETEERLRAILEQRTGKIGDVLAVEQEIARVRGEIEQMEAEQKSIEHRVDFATINLQLTEEYKAQLNSPAPSAGTLLRNAAVNGFRNAFENLLGLLILLTESGPMLLLWLAILFFPARFVWRRYRRALAA